MKAEGGTSTLSFCTPAELLVRITESGPKATSVTSGE